jgi:hypothetical protein
MTMRILLKTALIFTVALLSVNAVKAQPKKVDKKAAKIAAFVKMIDSADWMVIMEKAFPKPAAGRDVNAIDLSGTPQLSVSHGVAQCDLPYYGDDQINSAGVRIKFTSTHFDYTAEHKSGSTSPYQYDILISPKPGATDMGNIAQVVVSIINEDVVQVQFTLTTSSSDTAGFQGYILPYKKQD